MKRLTGYTNHRPVSILSTLIVAGRGLAADRQGTVAIEFAIVSVPFIGLLFAIFQLGLVFFAQQGLQAAVYSAARSVMIGSVQANSAITTAANFRDSLICPTGLMPSYMACSSLMVDVRPASSFGSMSTTSVSNSFVFDGSGQQFNPGCQGSIVVVRAAYPLPVFLPILVSVGVGSNISQNRSGLSTVNGQLVQLVTAAAVFRNEPFGSVGSCT